jgi:hypothetical protein
VSWARGDVQDGGRVGCAILDDGTVVVTWTDEDYLIEGFVGAPGTAQAHLAALFDWRDRNAHFQD